MPTLASNTRFPLALPMLNVPVHLSLSALVVFGLIQETLLVPWTNHRGPHFACAMLVVVVPMMNFNWFIDSGYDFCNVIELVLVVI